MKKIKLSELTGERNNNYFILAETAFSHEGNIEYFKKQIDDAVKGNANGVKFQILLDVADSYSENTEIFKNFYRWKIDEESWIMLIDYAKSKDLEVVVLPIDSKSMDFVRKNKDSIDGIEVHSICFNQVPFLKDLSDLDSVLILGVGGRSLFDIDFTLNEMEKLKSGIKHKIILMYGFQSFPTDYEKLNLSKLYSLKEKYKCVLGYADHTSFSEIKMGNEIIKYAYIYGARLFEKHIVLKKGAQRIDYEAAVGYQDLKELRGELDSIVKILGKDDLTILNEVELKYKNREKQLVASRDLKKGEILKNDTIMFKVTLEKSDFEQKDYNYLLNKKLKQDIDKNKVFKSFHIDG